MTQVLVDETLQTVVVQETSTTVIVRAPGPTSPAQIVIVGMVERANTGNGQIFIRVR